MTAESAPIIISVHVPKCAGRSLRAVFEKHFSPQQIYNDYDDSPFHPGKAVNTDPDYFERFRDPQALAFTDGKRVVHGHFHPNKYAPLAPALRITLLRDPVERLISHYFFWQHFPRHNHPLHDYMLDHNLTLAGFAELEPVRHFYTGVFFRDVPMEQFNLIGSVETNGAFLTRLSQLVERPFSLPVVNVNSQNRYAMMKSDLMANAKHMARLRQLLQDDIAFYEKWAGHGCR